MKKTAITAFALTALMLSMTACSNSDESSSQKSETTTTTTAETTINTTTTTTADTESKVDESSKTVEEHIMAGVTSGKFEPEIVFDDSTIQANGNEFEKKDGVYGGKSYFEIKDGQIVFSAEITNNLDEDLTIGATILGAYEYYPDTGKEVNDTLGAGVGSDFTVLKPDETMVITKAVDIPEYDYYLTYEVEVEISSPEEYKLGALGDFISFEYR